MLRVRGATGRVEQVVPDDWRRLDAIYRDYAGPRNGPLLRVEPWWREAVLRDFGDSGDRSENDAFVWVDSQGHDQGYVVYRSQQLPRDGRFPPWEVWVRDLVALGGDAYLGLWSHLLTHDLARQISIEVAPHDPFPDLLADPWKVRVTGAEGAMLRIVDVERAISLRPYCGHGHAVFTMRLADSSAPWNEGTWRVEALEGRLRAERADAEPDVEMSVNVLAPLFTGHMRADVAAGVGLLKVNRPAAVAEMAEAFAVTHPPFCNDFY